MRPALLLALLSAAAPAHAQLPELPAWDRGLSMTTPADTWTGTQRPMPDGSSQTIWNSDSGHYMLCTARPIGDGRHAVISCD